MYKYLLLLFIMVTTNSLYASEDDYLSVAMEVAKMPEGEKLDELVDSIVSSQIMTNPSIRPIKRAFEVFYKEIFSSEEFKLGLANIQMELFTYEELLELKELMKTPVFKKYEEIMPKYLSKNMELGNQIVTNKQERLKELIEKEQDHIAKLQELDKELMLTTP